MTEQKIECFVPAMALEHLANPEVFTRHQKLKFALLRYHLNKDFFSRVTVPDPLPGVFIEKETFNKEMLGYDVCAVIRCG